MASAASRGVAGEGLREELLLGGAGAAERGERPLGERCDAGRVRAADRCRLDREAQTVLPLLLGAREHQGRALEHERDELPVTARRQAARGRPSVGEHLLETVAAEGGAHQVDARAQRHAVGGSGRRPAPLGDRQQVLGGGRAAAEGMQPGADDGDLWMPLERRVVEEGQPALDHAGAAAVDLAQGEGGHDPRRVVDVAAGDGVPKRRVGLVVGLQPRGGAAVERRRRLRLVTLDLPPQQVV